VSGVPPHLLYQHRRHHLQVHMPDNGQTVDLSSGSSSYRVALSDAVMDGVALRPIGDYQLGWLAGTVGPSTQVRDASRLLNAVAASGNAAMPFSHRRQADTPSAPHELSHCSCQDGI
jgi:hypothetical protein